MKLEDDVEDCDEFEAEGDGSVEFKDPVACGEVELTGIVAFEESVLFEWTRSGSK